MLVGARGDAIAVKSSPERNAARAGNGAAQTARTAQIAQRRKEDRRLNILTVPRSPATVGTATDSRFHLP
jgi:hypothetical protein